MRKIKKRLIFIIIVLLMGSCGKSINPLAPIGDNSDNITYSIIYGVDYYEENGINYCINFIINNDLKANNNLLYYSLHYDKNRFPDEGRGIKIPIDNFDPFSLDFWDGDNDYINLYRVSYKKNINSGTTPYITGCELNGYDNIYNKIKLPYIKLYINATPITDIIEDVGYFTFYFYDRFGRKSNPVNLRLEGVRASIIVIPYYNNVNITNIDTWPTSETTEIVGFGEIVSNNTNMCVVKLHLAIEGVYMIKERYRGENVNRFIVYGIKIISGSEHTYIWNGSVYNGGGGSFTSVNGGVLVVEF